VQRWLQAHDIGTNTFYVAWPGRTVGNVRREQQLRDHIHFARWVITPDGRHLIFLSNFDGSWESYLNDFIDLAASGLTAVWTHTDNAVGFPRTRWLVREGARDEARFKAYARFSMVPTNVWYSAYPDISVANIDNNMRIRADLVAPLDRSATEAWLRRL
jgi:hypothetical protein